MKLIILNNKDIDGNNYVAHHENISTANAHNSRQTKLFKSRELKWHEAFNIMINIFIILGHNFWHSTSKSAKTFEFVAVICTYKIESAETLFNILI